MHSPVWPAEQKSRTSGDVRLDYNLRATRRTVANIPIYAVRNVTTSPSTAIRSSVSRAVSVWRSHVPVAAEGPLEVPMHLRPAADPPSSRTRGPKQTSAPPNPPRTPALVG